MRRAWALVLCAALTAPVARASETTTYTYDALGRLVVSSNAGGPRDGKAILSSYDDAGNRRTHAVGVPAPSIPNATVFSVSGPQTALDEGGAALFIVSRSGTATQDMTVSFATVAGSAGAPSDYTSQTGVLTFRHWETIKTISVPTVADQVSEPVEQFGLQLSQPSSGSSIGTATALATINASGAPAPNNPPVTVADTATVGVCMTVVRNVVANDTDPEGHYPLTVISVTSSTRGDAYVADSSSIGFAAYGTAGGTQVTYTVRDSLGATSTGVLGITVTNGSGCN